jgi:two-component system LytT family response regulator
MELLKALIIDDEPLARELIKNYVKHQSEIQIIGECENGFEGVRKISELKPDLVFLDIQMPKLNGFEMLELIESPPEIVFITAHNDFAIRAFEMNAVDYLLKPYSQERLLEAIEKAKQRIELGIGASKRNVLPNGQLLSETLERIVVKTGTKIKVIPVENIFFLEAQDDYIMIYSQEGKHLKQGTMKYFEDHLDPRNFIRVHRSYIVRIDQVTQLELYSKDHYLMKLRNNASIKVSRQGMRNLKGRFSF